MSEEGRRIAAEYLSKRGWAREWRRTLNRELYPAVQREEFEAKERQCDRMEEEAEEVFSREYDRLRNDPSPEAKAALETVLQMLGNRHDLGLIAQRIVDRMRHQLS